MFLKHGVFPKLPAKQRGSMLIVAIFVILVLGGLAIAMSEMQQDDAQSMVFEVYGARAFNAANSGLQHAINEVLEQDGDCVEEPAVTTRTVNLPNIAAFSGCSVTSTCQRFDISATGFRHYNMTSQASCSAGDFITQRRVQVQARVRN